jgi:Fis family transcriptional regulator
MNGYQVNIMSVVQDMLSEVNKLKTPEKFDSHKYLSVETDTDTPTENTSDSTLLRDCVCSVLTNYIDELEGHQISGLYELVMNEVEAPLLETVMDHTQGNQTKASLMLGINRGTLRKKLKQHGID